MQQNLAAAEAAAVVAVVAAAVAAVAAAAVVAAAATAQPGCMDPPHTLPPLGPTLLTGGRQVPAARVRRRRRAGASPP